MTPCPTEERYEVVTTADPHQSVLPRLTNRILSAMASIRCASRSDRRQCRIETVTYSSVMRDQHAERLGRIDPLWAGVVLCAVLAAVSALVILAQVLPTVSSWTEVILG